MSIKIPVSIFIIAKNEENRIRATLKPAIELANEVIVIDSGSTDKTQKICEELGAQFIVNEWKGYGPQKRFGEKQCKNKWLLNLDADEVMSPKLVSELRQLFKNGEPNKYAWKIPIVEVFPGETTIRNIAYSLSPVRLYNRDYGQYSDSKVHDRVDLKDEIEVGKLKNKIFHFSTMSLGQEIKKFNCYTDLQVKEMEEKGRILAPWRIVTEFPLAFLKAYFLRLYFLRGRFGYLLAMNYATFRHLRVAKYFERKILHQKESSDNKTTLPDKTT